MSLLLYFSIWFAVSCVTAPFIGALLGRSLDCGDEYRGYDRVPNSNRMSSNYRVADRELVPIAVPVNSRFPAAEATHRNSRRTAMISGRRR